MSIAVAPAPEAELKSQLQRSAQWVERGLETLLPKPDGSEARLAEAMRYAALDGGKRLRPFLVAETGRVFGAEEHRLVRAAAAVEAVHTYSLVHDDLPAMDNDDLRRGRPTTHVAFDDATAILAGDALLTIAFDWLSGEDTHPDPAVRCALVACLAQGSGVHGMAGGQMIDLQSEGKTLTLEAITRLHAMKTGALITASCLMGAVLGGAGEEERACIEAYGRKLGLAFQIADDVLDATASSEDLGKTAGKDAAQGKSTFVSLLGLEEARRAAQQAGRDASRALDPLGAKAQTLRTLADFVVTRRT